MQFTVTNELRKKNVVEQIEKFKTPFVINIEEFEEPKTLDQVKYFWKIMGILAAYYRDEGWRGFSNNDACYMLYEEYGIYEPKELPNGKKIYSPKKTLSQMNIKEASDFISFTLFWIDEFTNCVLLPELRLCWLLHITKEDLERIEKFNFPTRDKAYRASHQKYSCLYCGKFGCECAHISLPGHGGISQKAEDWLSVPLCYNCHRGEAHQHGQSEIIDGLKLYNFDIITYCKLAYLRWLYKK